MEPLETHRIVHEHDRLWTHDPFVLFHKARVLEFWPHPMHSREEKVNAIVRFAIYAAMLLYAMSKKPKYLAMGGLAAASVTLFYSARPWGRSEGVPCVQPKKLRRPTPQNPFANKMVLEDPADDHPVDDSPEAEEKRDIYFKKGLYMNFEDAWNKKSSERQYLTMPDNDQGAFAQYLYGEMKGKDMQQLLEKTSRL